MSKVFEVVKDTNYLSLCWKDKQSGDYVLDNINRGRLANQPTHKIMVEYGVNDSSDSREVDDYPCLSATIPVLSQRFVDIAKKELEANGQLFPIVGENKKFYLYNITTLVDAIDYENSDLVFSGDFLIDVNKLVLNEIKFSEPVIFKLTGDPLGPVYVNESFKLLVEESGLIGIKFI